MFIESHHCLCNFTSKSRLKLFYQTGETYSLKTYKSSPNVLFYFTWWIRSPTVAQCLLPNTIQNAFHTCMSEICAVLTVTSLLGSQAQTGELLQLIVNF